MEAPLVAQGTISGAEAARLLGVISAHGGLEVLAHGPDTVRLRLGSVRVTLAAIRSGAVRTAPGHGGTPIEGYRVILEATGEDPRESLLSILARAGLPAARFRISTGSGC
ncbi:MAG TPA: hypothetical protein VNL95_01905 [Dehalococcoidia bacterium]|nr:hypothetical protein [Dehalococcoidia bacterium]